MGGAPSIVVARICNTGSLPLEARFMFPKDDEDEPENWVDKVCALSCCVGVLP